MFYSTSHSRTARVLGAIATAVGCFTTVGSAVAQDGEYPTRPITLVIPFSPGGSADTLGRILAEKMAVKLGQSVVVENKAGAGTTVASSYVARAKPDGYTLYIGMMNLHGMDKVLYPGITYDGIKDFSHINQLITFPMVVVARTESPYNTFSDVVNHAKGKPDAISHASAGVGSSNHVAAVQFMKVAGVKLLNVPFKGGNPAAVATVAGDVDISFATPPTAMPMIKAGRLKALGLTADKPSPLFPGIPSAPEAGLPGYNFLVWHGLYGPAGIDKQVQEKLFKVTSEILADPEVQAKLHDLGMQEAPSKSIEEFNEFVRKVADDTAELARAAKDDQ